MLTVFAAVSHLTLPVREVEPADEQPVSFGEPEVAEPLPVTRREPGEQRWTVSRDLARDTFSLYVVKDLGTVTVEDVDMSVTRRAEETYTFTGDDFSSAHGETRWVMAAALQPVQPHLPPALAHHRGIGREDVYANIVDAQDRLSPSMQPPM